MHSQKAIFSYITTFLLLSFIFFIPVWTNISLLILPYLILSCVISCPLKGFGQKMMKNRFFIILAIFWLLHFVSAIYSDNREVGIRYVMQMLSLIGFPLIFIALSGSEKFNFKWVLNAFIIGCFVSMVVCIANALINSVSFEAGKLIFDPIPADYPWENHFTYVRLAYLNHPTYMAMFLSFAIILLFDMIKSCKLKLWRFSYITGILICGVFIYFLSSRAGILAGIIAVVMGFAGFAHNWKRKLAILGTSVVLLAGVFISSYNIEGSFSQKIVDKLLYGNNLRDLDVEKKEDPRVEIWNSIPGIVLKRPIFGYGIGDTPQVLQSAYKRNNAEFAYENSLGVHNQFLETTLSIGFVGLALLLFILIYPLVYFRKSKDFLLPLSFIIIICVNFLFESGLTRIFGVLFFSIFYSLFFCTGILKQNS